MQDPLLEQLQARKERKNYAMVTIVDSFGSTPRTNGKMLVYENGLSKGTVGGGHHEQMAKRDAVACIASGQNALKRYEIKAPAAASGAVCTGGITVFIEVFRAAPLLVVCGGGHVGRSLIRIAKEVGFDVLLVDTRDAGAIAESVAMADRFEQVPDFASGLRALGIDPTALLRSLLLQPRHRRRLSSCGARQGMELRRHGREPRQNWSDLLAEARAWLFRRPARRGPYAHWSLARRGNPGGDRRCHHGRDHRRAARKDTKLFLTPQFPRKGRRSVSLQRPFPSVKEALHYYICGTITPRGSAAVSVNVSPFRKCTFSAVKSAVKASSVPISSKPKPSPR